MDSVQMGQHLLDSIQSANLLDSPATLKDMVVESVSMASKSEFFQGGLLLGALAWLGMQLKSVPIGLWSRFKRSIKFTVYFDDNNTTYQLFTDWFNKNHPEKFKNVIVNISQGSKSVEKDKRFTLKISQFQDWNWFWYKGNLIFVAKSRETLENAGSTQMRHLHSYTLHSFFSKKQM
jgi:hypothetical protein